MRRIVTALMIVGASPAAGQTTSRVPLSKGLTIVTAGHWTQGDYESLKRVTEVADSGGIRFTYSGRTPGVTDPKQQFTVIRRVRGSDLRQSRRYKISFSPLDEEIAPGTTALGTSAAVLRDLKIRGSSPFWVINEAAGGSLAALADAFMTGSDYKGTLTRVETGPVPVPVLLAGERVTLPAVHAQGRFGEGEHAQVGEFWFLDDSTNPLALKFVFGSGTLQVVRIDFPVPQRIEQALAAGDTAVAYGLYFEFASAEIRPESQPVLQEIADVMTRHPDWKLRVAGHTDSIGNPASNLELSRRRAESVMAALGRLGVPLARLETTGFGAALPKEPNTTLEGRARNRRVELTRD